MCSSSGADVLVERSGARRSEQHGHKPIRRRRVPSKRGSTFTATATARASLSRATQEKHGRCELSVWCRRAGRKRSGARRSEQHGHKSCRRRRVPSKRGFDLHGHRQQHARHCPEQYSRKSRRRDVLTAWCRHAGRKRSGARRSEQHGLNAGAGAASKAAAQAFVVDSECSSLSSIP